MTTSWDRQAGETAAWYERFTLYLYMGPDRTVAAAHSLANRLAVPASLAGQENRAVHGQLASWQRTAKRNQWQARAAEYDAELCRKALAGNEHLRMVMELLPQVFGALRHADLLTLSKEEARQLLPTFRLFFRDLLQFYQSAAAQAAAGKAASELNADDLAAYLSKIGGWPNFWEEIERVTEGQASEAEWRPLRDVLAQLYPDEASTRRIAAQAHLDSARIHFSARAVDGWHAVLTEAAHAGKLEQIIGVVQEEYQANQELAKAVRRLRQAHSPPKKARVQSKARGSKARGSKHE